MAKVLRTPARSAAQRLGSTLRCTELAAPLGWCGVGLLLMCFVGAVRLPASR